MRPAYFAWIFPSLLRQSKRAEERSDPAEMRAARRRAQVAADRIEVALGAGSVVKLGGAGLAQAPADKIGALAKLGSDLRDYAGQSCWGVGLTVKEAEIARDHAAKYGQALVAYSPVLGGGLKKSEEISKALKDVSVGQRIDKPSTSGQVYDYNHVLAPQLKDAGYGIEIHEGLPSVVGRRLSASVLHAGKPVGHVTGDIIGDRLDVEMSRIDPQHAGKKLGRAAYEALMAHALNNLQVKGVSSDSISDAGEATHIALASKHGLDYQRRGRGYEYALSKEEHTPTHQLEAILRDAADAYEERQLAARRADGDRLSQARAKAAAAIDGLRAGGRLERQAQEDPDGYQATMALIEATQEALAKGGTFKGLPIPHISKIKGSPVGTVLMGKIKVDTAEGPKWRGARGGLVRESRPAAVGGKMGAVASARLGR